MQYFAGLILFMAAQHSNQEDITKIVPLTLTASCKGNPTCEFTGEDMPIQILIRNDSMSVIGLPVEYIDRTGPFIKIIDALSKKEHRLSVNLGPEELAEKFHQIRPSESVELDASLLASEVRTFRNEKIDLNVELVISSRVQIDGGEIVKYRAKGTFRVQGKDLLEQKK